VDILKLVPQLFYDLISRVIPGFVALAVLAAAVDLKLGKLATDFWDGAKAMQDSALFLGFGFLLAAYLVGHILSPISDFLEKHIAERLFPAYYRVLKNAVSGHSDYSPSMQSFFLKELGLEKGDDPEKVPLGRYRKTVFVWFDWLRINNPDAGARAAKIRAEYRMHSQNAVVFILALLMNLISTYVSRSSLKFDFLIVMATVGLASIWATARTYQSFQFAVLQQFYPAKTYKAQAKPD
jgi:hypothetical protein